MTLDPNRLALLFQGNDPREKIVLPAGEVAGYRHIPYMIGLLQETTRRFDN